MDFEKLFQLVQKFALPIKSTDLKVLNAFILGLLNTHGIYKGEDIGYVDSLMEEFNPEQKNTIYGLFT